LPYEIAGQARNDSVLVLRWLWWFLWLHTMKVCITAWL